MISILCINLKRRLDKRSAFLGAMFAQDVPDNVINFFDAYDAAAYETAEAAREHMNAEFPQAKVESNLGAGSVCLIFSYLKCLDQIASFPNESRTILMMDHTVFGVKWQDIQRLIDSLNDFNVFQIQIFDSESLNRCATENYSEDINAGVLGNGASCSVFTPDGARMVLDIFLANRINIVAEDIGRLIGDQPLVFSAKKSGHWLRRHLNLSKWTGVIDSDKEYCSYHRGGKDELAHFSIGSKRLRDMPAETIGFKRKAWGTR